MFLKIPIFALTTQCTVPYVHVIRRYLDSSSLVGNIRRLSSNPLAAADLTLPAPGDAGSLSNNAEIIVEAASQVRMWMCFVVLYDTLFAATV